MRRRQDVELNGQVRMDEVGRVGLVLENAAHLAGGENDIVGRISVKEKLHRLGIPQLKLATRRRQDLVFPVAAEAPQRRRSDQPGMACDVYFRRGHFTGRSADTGRRGCRNLRTRTAHESAFSTVREWQDDSRVSRTAA